MFLSYPEKICFPIPPEKKKRKKRKSKGMSSLPALQLIYIRIYYVGLPLNLPLYKKGINYQHHPDALSFVDVACTAASAAEATAAPPPPNFMVAATAAVL